MGNGCIAQGLVQGSAMTERRGMGVGWGRGGRQAQEGGGDTCIYIELIHAVAEQKLTQHCNAPIPQF